MKKTTFITLTLLLMVSIIKANIIYTDILDDTLNFNSVSIDFDRTGGPEFSFWTGPSGGFPIVNLNMNNDIITSNLPDNTIIKGLTSNEPIGPKPLAGPTQMKFLFLIHSLKRLSLIILTHTSAFFFL